MEWSEKFWIVVDKPRLLVYTEGVYETLSSVTFVSLNNSFVNVPFLLYLLSFFVFLSKNFSSFLFC